MNVADAVDQACADVGIYPPKRIDYGKWLNTDTLAGKSGKGDGRVIIQEHFVTAWNWQTGLKSTVGLRDGISAKEQRAIAQSVARSKAKAEQDATRAAGLAVALMQAAKLSSHPYLATKGFRDEKAMVTRASDVRRIGGDYLVPDADCTFAIVVPARIGGKIVSAQLIWENGAKKFLFGGITSGASHRICSGVDTWLCEGYATGLSLRTALSGLKVKATILCCFSASNVVAVARHGHDRGRTFIATDNDKPLEHFGWIGTGEHYARQADLPYGMPPDVGTDFNDMHKQAGVFAVQRVLTSIMSGRRAV